MKSQSLKGKAAKATMADWSQIEQKFRSTGYAAPQAGFSDRWQSRWQQAERKRQRVLNNWRVVANGLIVLGLLALWGFSTWFIFTMLAPLVAERLGSSLSFFASILTASLAILKALPMSVLMMFGLLLTAAVLDSAMAARMRMQGAEVSGRHAQVKRPARRDRRKE